MVTVKREAIHIITVNYQKKAQSGQDVRGLTEGMVSYCRIRDREHAVHRDKRV
jgi:non-ribosomal peptide synthetase component E (peptide arylation enzyme)